MAELKLTGTRSVPASSGRTARLRMRWLGAEKTPAIAGEDRRRSFSNYLVGLDSQAWRTQIPHYAKVRYRSIYPGIDLVFHGSQRQLEYDFIVAPGADPDRIQLEFGGVDAARISDEGDLVIEVDGTTVIQRKPFVYQGSQESQIVIEGAYKLVRRSSRTVQATFTLANYDRSRQLVIDPVLEYSTGFGGSYIDDAKAIAVDAAGSAYIAGYTASVDFDTKNPIEGNGDGNNSIPDAFVTKLSPAGDELIYSTYLGGSSADYANAIAVDGSGNAYVAGFTGSTDFNTVNQIQGCAADYDAFIAKLSPSGSALVYSTCLGGSGQDEALSIDVDSSGSAYVAGRAQSANFDVVNPIPSSNPSNFGGTFVSKLSPAGNSLIYSTLFGGDLYQVIRAVAVDGAGNAYVAGVPSTNPPLVSPARTEKGDGFAAKINAAGSGLVYSTYVAGEVNALAIDSEGNAFVAGMQRLGVIPTNPLPPDAFVTKLNSSGTSFIYYKQFGGSHIDYATAVGVDDGGSAYIAGIASSDDFPTVNAIQPFVGPEDVFLTKVTPTADSLSYSTTLGGIGDSRPSIAVDSSGNAYVTQAPIGLDGIDVSHSGVSVAKISDPGPVGQVQFSSSSTTVSESAGSVGLVVTRTGDASLAASVGYSTASGGGHGNGTAQTDVDFVNTPGRLSWAAGDATTRTITIPITDDDLSEGAEDFVVALGNPRGINLTDAHFAFVVIAANDQGAGTVKFSSASYSSPENAVAVVVSALRTGGSTGSVSSNYTTSDGSASAGTDYSLSSGTVTWEDGDVSPKPLSVTIVNDSASEDSETFAIALSAPTNGATLGAPATATISIADDDEDPGTLQFSGASYSLAEGAGSVTISVSRTGGAGGTASVDFATSSRAAIAASDYTAIGGTLSWADGDSTPKSFAIPIVNDTSDEPDESFVVLISNVQGAAIGLPDMATVTIQDDDTQPPSEGGGGSFGAASLIAMIAGLVFRRRRYVVKVFE
jgi:hypothetical protein